MSEAPPAAAVPRWQLAAGAAVCLAAILPAARGSAEFSTHLASEVARRQPPGTLFGRSYLAEGIDAETFRPLSVLLVRAQDALGGALSPAAGLAHGLLALLLLPALAAWCRARSAPGLFLPVLAGTLLSAPGLFNTWHLGEFDGLGTSLLLLADALLLRHRATGRPAFLLYCLPLWGAALLLKDSVAVLALALLAAAAWDEWRAAPALPSPGSARPATLLLAAAAAALWVFFTQGRLLPPGSSGPHAGAPATALLLSAATVSFAQILAMFGPALPVALLAGAAGSRLRPRAAVALLALLPLLLPEPVWFQFFLCYVADSARWCQGWGVVLLLSLLILSLRNGETRASAARAAFLGILAFALLPALLRMRADVSSRVFLPLLPWLLLPAQDGLRRLAGAAGRTGRAAALLLFACLLGSCVLGGLRFGVPFLASERLELRGKSELVRLLLEEPRSPALLLPLHRSWELTRTELQALRPPGAAPLPPLRIHRLHVPVPEPGRVPEAPPRGGALAWDFGRPLASLLGSDGRAYTWRMGGRSLGTAEARRALRGRYDGRRRASPWPLPPFSFELDHFRVFADQDGVTEWLAADGSVEPLWQDSSKVLLPPPSLRSALVRLVTAAPLIERQAMAARIDRVLPR